MVDRSMDEVLMMANLHAAGAFIRSPGGPALPSHALSPSAAAELTAGQNIPEGYRPAGTMALEAGCPWDGWKKPNVEWCESPVCGLIDHPANTFSNLAFILAGAVMIAKAGQSIDLRLFGPAAIATGVFSGLFHASGTQLFQWFDFVGMYMFCMLPVVINLRRLNVIRRDQQMRAYWFSVLGCGLVTSPLQRLGFPIQLLVVLLVLLASATELRAKRVCPELVQYRHFAWAVLLLALGLTCSLLDLTRVWCDPDDHVLQGHAVWHVLTAGALLCEFRHYAELEASERAALKPVDRLVVGEPADGPPKPHESPASSRRWARAHRRATSVDIEAMLFSAAASDAGAGLRKAARNRSCDDLAQLVRSASTPRPQHL